LDQWRILRLVLRGRRRLLALGVEMAVRRTAWERQVALPGLDMVVAKGIKGSG